MKILRVFMGLALASQLVVICQGQEKCQFGNFVHGAYAQRYATRYEVLFPLNESFKSLQGQYGVASMDLNRHLARGQTYPSVNDSAAPV
jgi:hypothetical protein